MCNEQRYTESGAPLGPARCKEYQALKEENARLREALEFYAYAPGGDNLIMMERGEKARKALKEVG